MTPLFHAASAMPATAGSPLYDILPEHEIAIVAVLVLPLVAWAFRLRAARSSRFATLVAGYEASTALVKFTVWLLAISATVHLALAFSHAGQTRVLFAVQAVALAVVIGRLLGGRSWRLPAAVVLTGSIGAFWLANLGGEAPDQLGLATKLIELTALAVVIRPMPGRRIRGLLASTAVVLLVVATATAGWIGAFRATAGAGGDGHAHSHAPGSVATPGSVLPLIEDREPTPGELAEAERLRMDVAAAIAPYADLAIAAAAGFDVEGIHGTNFHAANKANEEDGRVLDPSLPETLVYAAGPEGPVLLGAMFVMPSLGAPGPAVGGPATIWHAHENICLSLTPPALTGILSPLGNCPVGSIAWPVTPEMIHVWTVPGAPEPFGDLDEGWLRDYLAVR
jgi:hypothetical protein